MGGSLDPGGFGRLLQLFAAEGYRVIGPHLDGARSPGSGAGGALVLGDLGGYDDLPAGWTDAQRPGEYRLARRSDRAVFGHASGPQPWKRYLHPPVLELFSTWRGPKRLVILDDADRPQSSAPRAGDPVEKIALVGARACDLAALRVLDRVLAVGPWVDTAYAARRAAALIVAVQCGSPGGTCFCGSMGTGPEISGGADLVVTELPEGPRGHRFLVEPESEVGKALWAKLVAAGAVDAITDEERAAGQSQLEHARAHMGRTLDTTGLAAALGRAREHPRWDDVAARCLGCTSCTMVCPTCFCTTTLDTSSLDGETATRTRYWDSCFTLPFSEIHGAPVRPSPRARYRQWLTHKLSSWVEQFGTFGCVGCGRCITWCPVGIDLVAEAQALRAAAEGERA